MKEEFGYEVTPEQSLDALWKTMHKYIHHHGMSDISLEMEGSQYEFRHHLKRYEEYKAKAQAFDEIVKAREKVGNEIGLSDYYEVEDFGRTVIDIVDRSDSQ